MSMEKDDGVAVKGRATIDTRPPFRSVKEAVALFGERVLVGEIYAKQLKEIQVQSSSNKEEHVTSTLATISAELEEAKQNLKKAREEGNYMANCLKSLRDELEQTKKELHKLKSAKDVVIIEHPKAMMVNPEIEELKFIEIKATSMRDHIHNDDEHKTLRQEFQKKKFVSFASPPSLTREMIQKQNQNQGNGVDVVGAAAKLGRTPSFRKEVKKKQLVPIMGWLFQKKKRNFDNNGDCSPNA